MPPLLGRDDELRRVAAVVAHARNKSGGALLVAGEPGIGKTTLLAAATADRPGLRMLRVNGFESEATMPFAAVQRLIMPLRDHLPALPERHRQALRVAAGEAEGPPPDRFLIGLGVLGLLAAAGEAAPVICVVDDAHLLDPESLDALAFVARRLRAESAAVIFGARDVPDAATRFAGVPELRLPGLGTEPAVQLLTASLPVEARGRGLDPAVAARIVAATGGNPLALVDLAGELTVRQLTESSLGDEPIPVGRHLESLYQRQVRGLPPEAQLWLLVAAADSTGDADLIAAAAGRLGLSGQARDAAETAGLVELGPAVRFRHPLIRSAVYNAAHGKDRRRVHRALSAVAQEAGRVEREAWHAAKATLGTDEEVAKRLERVADTAGDRGGFASRARMLAQASALTPPGPQKYARLVGAAEAALSAGTGQLAKDLIDEVDEDLLDPVPRARLIVLSADHALFTADPALRHGGADLLAAARLFHGHDDLQEQNTLIRAWELVLPAERLATGATLRELGERMRAGAEVREGPAARILRALSALILLPYREAVPIMRDAVRAYQEMDAAALMQYGQSSVALTTALWDADARMELLERTSVAARDAGSLQLLDCGLWVQSLTEALTGNPRRATDLMEQVRELRRAIGYDAEHVINMAVLAWTAAPVAQVDAMAEGARQMGFGGVHSAAVAALAIADVAAGRPESAYARLKPQMDDPFLHTTPLYYGDFVEACVRLGHHEEAAETARRLTERADASGSPWARSIAARSRALLAPDTEAEEQYQAAITGLPGTRVVVDEGRAHLLYGEWLRRMRRRRDARTQLRRAAELFTGAGAGVFAERAARELRALGDNPAGPGERPPLDLTAQQLTVARLAAAGHTNAEIGAAMFLSANTVDYHLRRIFAKLGVSSRRQLTDRLGPST
jgi:DNA-binding CsgD family transcriptional regulator